MTTLGMGVRRAADKNKKVSVAVVHDPLPPQIPVDLRSGSRSDQLLDGQPETSASAGAGKADAASTFDAGPSAYISIESLPRPIGEPVQCLSSRSLFFSLYALRSFIQECHLTYVPQEVLWGPRPCGISCVASRQGGRWSHQRLAASCRTRRDAGG